MRIRLGQIALTFMFLTELIACGNSSSDRPTLASEPTTASDATSDVPLGQSVIVGDTTALLWGEGTIGVMLFHGAIYDAASWSAQAERIAEEGMVVLALEELGPGNVSVAVDYLRIEMGVSHIAVIGSSAGTGPAIFAARSYPEIVNQLIGISGSGNVGDLGPFPKLFVASEGETSAVRSAERMLEEAAGVDNATLIMPGSAHGQAIFGTDRGPLLMQAIIDQLAKYDE